MGVRRARHLPTGALKLVGRAQESRCDVVPLIGEMLVRLDFAERIEELSEHEGEPGRCGHE